MASNRFVLVILLGILLSACGVQDDIHIRHDPVAFESSDECHVCGMVISQFVGPKGQAFESRNNQVQKFCSTMELFIWYLQPENKPNITDIYVHDMSQTPWDKPDDAHLISARDAYFVINSNLQGSMGKTLASFLIQKDAIDFASKHNGEVITFNEITLAALSHY